MAKRGKRGSVVEQQDGNGEVVVQLATRIPKALQKRLKLYSVDANVSISEFVAGAIEMRLDKETGRKVKAA